MRKGLLLAGAGLVFALIAVAATELAHRWAPYRGPGFGPEGDPFLADSTTVEERAGAPSYRVVLVGDAGAPEPEDPTLALVGSWADAYPDRTTVLFLGDNLYPAGLQPGDRERGERVLLQLLQSTRSPKILVPGNHDWGFSRSDAHTAGVLAREQAFVEAQADLDADFLPKNGCPGPVTRELIEPAAGLPGGLTLIVLDLHWWLLAESERPVCEGIEATRDFIERLRGELERQRGRNVVVAAHHPIRSGGPHGGYTRGFWRDVGAALFYRFYSVQDLIEPSYHEIVALLSEVLSESPPLAMVGGHDHSLQVLDGGDEAKVLIVSGSATRVSRVTRIPETLFAHARRGFVVLDLYGATASGPGLLLVQVVETGRERPVATFAVDLSEGRSARRRARDPGA